MSNYRRIVFSTESMKESIEEHYNLKIQDIWLYNAFSIPILYNFTTTDKHEYLAVLVSNATNPAVANFVGNILFFKPKNSNGLSQPELIPTIKNSPFHVFEDYGHQFAYAVFVTGHIDQLVSKPNDTDTAFLMGRQLAQLHQGLDDTSVTSSAPHMLDYHINVIINYFPQNIELKEHMVQTLQEFNDLPFSKSHPEYGFISGGFTRNQLLIDQESNLLSIPTNRIHLNWRAVDLAITELSLEPKSEDDENVKELYEGYSSVRPLNDWEVEHHEFFLKIARIFQLASKIAFSKEVFYEGVGDLATKILDN